jgi:hypothetical protein
MGSVHRFVAFHDIGIEPWMTRQQTTLLTVAGLPRWSLLARTIWPRSRGGRGINVSTRDRNRDD